MKAPSSGISRRRLLLAGAGMTAASVTGLGQALDFAGGGATGHPAGIFDGTRFDAERNALLLAGEAGAYPGEGTYTSAPIALEPGAEARVVWQPRWTTPLEWDRFAANPVLLPTSGTWDDTTVTTCSIVPVGDALRMFYGARDRGIGLAVGDSRDIGRWVKRPGPLLQAGPSGAFDAGGVLSPAVVPVSDTHWYMYYVGYDPTRVRGSIKVHQIGLAESRDSGETWRRVRDEPVLGLGPEGSCDGATISSNSVLKVGERWYCWYTGISQIPYLASVCLATSDDGIHWRKYAHNPVLAYNPYVETDAFMVATPHVLHEEGVFKMWYNAKGFGAGRNVGDYRICYAESLDGIHWERSPRLPVLGPAGRGWDSQMVEYPEVLNIGGTHHLWYCGDGYGSIGHATGRPVTHATVETRSGASPTPDAGWGPWRRHDNPTGSRLDGSPRHAQIRVHLQTSDPGITPMVQNLSIRSN